MQQRQERSCVTVHASHADSCRPCPVLCLLVHMLCGRSAGASIGHSAQAGQAGSHILRCPCHLGLPTFETATYFR